MDPLKVLRDVPLSSLISTDHPLKSIILELWDQMAGLPLGVDEVPAE